MTFRPLIGALATATALSSAVATAQSESKGLTVRDVCVYQVSAYGQQLNARSLFRSTLPATMLSQRPAAPRDATPAPMPIGLITLEGSAVDDMDVMLEFSSGRFVAHWPPAHRRSKRLLWAGLKVNADPTDSPRITRGHWLSRLFDAPRLYAHRGSQSSRALVYDAEIEHQPQLKVKWEQEQFHVENAGPWPVHDFTLYVPAADGKRWTVSAALEVPGVGKAPKTEPSKDEPNPESVFETADPAPAGTPVDQPAEGTPAADNAPAATPAAVATSDNEDVVEEPAVPSEAAAGAIHANDTTGTPAAGAAEAVPAIEPKRASLAVMHAEPVDAVTALSSWHSKLAELGLGEPEIEHVLEILQHAALRSEAAIAIYRLDPQSLEELLPLEITPLPETTVRVGLVILIDCDPQLEASINDLITQLGDPNWKTRIAAQARLKAVSQAAIPKLTEAVNNADVEISYRAEQLLEELQAQPR